MSIKIKNLLLILMIGLTNSSLSHAEPAPYYEIEIIAFEQPQLAEALNEQWPETEPSRPNPELQRLFSRPAEQPPSGHLENLSDTDSLLAHGSLSTSADPMKAEATSKQRLNLEPLTPTEAQALAQLSASKNGLAAPSDRNQLPLEFTLLSREQLQLTAIKKTLLRKRLARRLLLHTGWVQQIRPAKAAVPVLLEGGNPLTINQPSHQWLQGRYRGYINKPVTLQTNEFNIAEFELGGTISFYETRYPRIETNLCQTINPELLANSFIQLADSSRLNSKQICSQEVRGLSYGELVYFDTPSFGLLVQIRLQPLPLSQHKSDSGDQKIL